MKNILFCFFLLAWSFSYAEDLRKVGSDPGGMSLYVDLDSIKVRGQHVYFWSLVDYSEEIGGVRSHHVAKRANCSSRKDQGLKFVYYSGQMAKGMATLETTIQYPRWNVNPDSLTKMEIKIVCDRVRGNKD